MYRNLYKWKNISKEVVEINIKTSKIKGSVIQINEETIT